MIPLATFRELFDFNYWARDRQLEACAALSSEQFLRPMGNSFSSVRDTLAHLLVAEWIWLERWRGRTLSRQDVEAYKATTLSNLEAIREAWTPVENGVRDFLQACTEGKLSQPLTYINFKGKQWTYSLGQTLFHVVNHQTYHRGQISTLLRQLGAEAVSIDYLVALDVNFSK